MNQKLPVPIRLIRFVCLWFISAFVLLTIAHFITIRIDLARMLTFTEQEANIDSLLTAGWRSLVISIYITILFGLSYSARYKFPIVSATMSVVVLSLFWCGLFSLALGVIQGGSPRPTETAQRLGGAGLITMDGDQAQVILQDPNLSGMRVLAPSDSPLRYENSQERLGVPALFFGKDSVYFMEKIMDNFTRAGEQCAARLRENLLSFVLYILALVFCLGSLHFVFNLSSWPLANLFLGLLLCWGILELEALLNSDLVWGHINIVTMGFFPRFLLVPLAFFLLGTLFLFLLIKKRRTAK